jgi:hypothetical protein
MIFYYIAIDADPDTDNHLKARADDQVEPLFCFLLHLAITLRVQIFKYKKTHSSSVAPQQLPISTITQMYFQNMGKVTLADFLTSSILALWIGSLAIDNLLLTQISSPNYSFLLFGFLYYANSFSGVAISGVYLCRHSHLRQKLKKELVSAIQNIT